jgi:Asp-tRNA(Asn)/Glu-tRNA(Gln) amidotransferase A subunit family amidase
MRLDEYLKHDAIGLASAVRAGEVSAAELLALARERRDAVNARINAVIAPIDAQADARAADRHLAGPLAGVPFLIKDLHQEYAGVPSFGGSRSLAKHVPTEHSTVVARWLDAGLIPFGRTNTPEFGAKGITEPELFGPARNPWNTDHTPGGSSGGSAAAVAAGIVPVAGANDGGGSIRIPASCCGLFGLKAGRGVVPAGPAAGEAMHGSAIQGVVSRSVRDSALMLDVLAGNIPESPYLGAISLTPYADDVTQDPGTLRIGVCVASAINPDPDPEARQAARDAAALLERLGHDVVELPAAPFDDAELAHDFLITWFVECAHTVAEIKARFGATDRDFEADTLVMAALGRATSSVEYCDALARRQRHVRRLTAFHSDHDLLLTPTTAAPPPRIGQFDRPAILDTLARGAVRGRVAGLLRKTPIVEQIIADNLGWVPYTQLANLTGRPAMSVPLHWTAAGLPLGVQFVAPLGGESMLLRLGGQLEAAQPWADRRPAGF